MCGTWKYSESPLLDGDLVICTPGSKNGTVLALKKDSGVIAWKSQGLGDRAEYTSLAIAEIGGVRQYIVFTMKSVAGISAKNGKVLWRVARKGKTAICSTPLYSDGIVFVASGYGVGCNAFAVSGSGSRFTARQIYSGKQLLNHHGGMILLDGYVYGLDDKKGLTCLELKSGKIAWQERSVGKGSTVYADGHFVVRSENAGKGEIALVEATPRGYTEKGRFRISGDSKYRKWAHPVIAGGRMYIRDQDILYCYKVSAR